MLGLSFYRPLFLNPKDLDKRFDDVKPILLELSSIAKNDNLSLANYHCSESIIFMKLIILL